MNFQNILETFLEASLTHQASFPIGTSHVTVSTKDGSPAHLTLGAVLVGVEHFFLGGEGDVQAGNVVVTIHRDAQTLQPSDQAVSLAASLMPMVSHVNTNSNTPTPIAKRAAMIQDTPVPPPDRTALDRDFPPATDIAPLDEGTAASKDRTEPTSANPPDTTTENVNAGAPPNRPLVDTTSTDAANPPAGSHSH